MRVCAFFSTPAQARRNLEFMERGTPQQIASRTFKQFIIVCVCIWLGGFALKPLFFTDASGSYICSSNSPKANSDIGAYLNANGFRLSETLPKPENAFGFKGCYKDSFPFAVSVSRPKQGSTDFMISVSYHFRGFEWKVNDSLRKLDDFKTSLSAWLNKYQAEVTIPSADSKNSI